jgi:hypothetical protein
MPKAEVFATAASATALEPKWLRKDKHVIVLVVMRVYLVPVVNSELYLVHV